jgi:hypothetical protein
MVQSFGLPKRLYAVLVANQVIALFTDELEASTYVRVLRGPESALRKVRLDGQVSTVAVQDPGSVVRTETPRPR